jgi:hypothetical protein
MSKTKREGHWDNRIDAPYTKPTYYREGPGPGMYSPDLKKSKIDECPKYSSERYCLRKFVKSPEPGPG